MRVSEFYPRNPCRTHEVYIVGLGPSMKHFPIKYLEKRCCVLLNDACRHFPNLGPIAFSNHIDFIEPTKNKRIKHIIVKGYQKHLDKDRVRTKEVNIVPWEHPNYYVYSYKGKYQNETKLFEHPDYFWSPSSGTVAQFAVQCVLQAGATAIFLVGVDCGTIAGDAYAVDGMLDAKNATLARDYDAYAEGLITLQREAMQRFRVPIMTLSPYIGLGRETAQYTHRQGAKHG